MSFDSVKTIQRMVLVGGQVDACYVEEFKLRYSFAAEVWQTYKDASGAERVFKGLTTKVDIGYYNLDPALDAMHVGFYPTLFETSICFRFEFYGCNSTVTMENDWGQ